MDSFQVSGQREEPSVKELFSELDTYTEPIPLDVLEKWIERTPIDCELARPYIRFHPEHYLRNLMYDGPAYQALILCWRSGQRSPIHDHWGSSCAVKILQGTATETIFERTSEGLVYPTESRFLSELSSMASASADIHQVSNLQPVGSDLITLHVYSPALLSMNVYSLLDRTVREFHDPINMEFVGGAGI